VAESLEGKRVALLLGEGKPAAEVGPGDPVNFPQNLDFSELARSKVGNDWRGLT
jgi:hypothetical protein